VTGYAHSNYAASLTEFGAPHLLTASGGWILKRSIPGTPHHDAMGCYPLFACRDWSQLPDDMENLTKELVSLVLVTDPFGDYTKESLHHSFNDLVRPFKEHFIVDLAASPQTFIHPHHQRNARKAMGVLSVEAGSAADWLNEWISLYADLVDRHNIRGIARFSDSSFAMQSKVPGGVMLRAIHEGRTVAMTWWFVSGELGYYHLGASSPVGYELGASFALFWGAIELFRDDLRWLDLGAGAGLANDAQDGLSRFKRGWSNGTRMTYLCGRVFDRTRYEQIAEDKGIRTITYFPAYRLGEFV